MIRKFTTVPIATKGRSSWLLSMLSYDIGFGPLVAQRDALLQSIVALVAVATVVVGASNNSNNSNSSNAMGPKPPSSAAPSLSIEQSRSPSSIAMQGGGGGGVIDDDVDDQPLPPLPIEADSSNDGGAGTFNDLVIICSMTTIDRSWCSRR